MTKEVTHQGKYNAVVRREHDGLTSYDVWQWNLHKRKWVRLSNTACGFGTNDDAKKAADEMDWETTEMLEAAKTPPPPLT